MAPIKRGPLFPRSKVRKMIQAHSGLKLAKSAEPLIYLNYCLFMKRLMMEAHIDAKLHGERGITERSLKRVGPRVLAAFKG